MIETICIQDCYFEKTLFERGDIKLFSDKENIHPCFEILDKSYTATIQKKEKDVDEIYQSVGHSRKSARGKR